MSTYPLLPQRVWNMRPWRSSPLMRTSYRVESILHAALIVLIALALPLAGALGTSTYTARVDQSDRIAASEHTVAAVLDADPKPKDSLLGVAPVTVHWTLDGRTYTGVAMVAVETKAGDKVSVWVGANGNQVAKPPSRSEALPDAVAIAVGAYGLFAAFMLTLWHLASRLLDWRRRTDWAHEWAALADARKWNHL